MQPKIIKLKFDIEILYEDIEREGAEAILIKALASAIPGLKEEIEILKLEEEVNRQDAKTPGKNFPLCDLASSR